MQSIRELWSSLWAGTKLNRTVRLAVVGLVAIAVIYAIYFLVEKIFIYLFARSYVDAIADAWDLNKTLANAIVLLVFMSTVFLVGLIFSISKMKRLIGVAGVILMLVGQSFIVWRGTADKFFDRSGHATKCYVVMRDWVRYGEQPGIDPATGRECRPVTAEVVERLNEYASGKRPTRITETRPIFFSLRTGEPIVWYYKNKDGAIELFSLMGFHPDTGEELLPVTKQVVELWKDQTERQKQLETRRIPTRIDLEKYPPFDPVTGEARVWYRKTENGDFVFYDWSGFDPQTGEELSPLNHDVLAEWQNHRKEPILPKCYVMTRDGVKYGDKTGLDAATGRQCHEITPNLLERLREYEKGNRPQKIETENPTFFDPRTGEAIAWYHKDDRGDIELFNLMGFDPETGEELLPVTKEIFEQWKMQSGKRAAPNPERIPQRVDADKYQFFDPLTGEPRAWYWRNEQGEYEFYNNPGYHARAGDKLKVFTKEDLGKYLKNLEVIEGQRKQEIEQKKQEQARREEEYQKEAARQEELRRQQEAKREREAQAAQLCDELAANPSDPRRGRNSDGVEFDALVPRAEEAIEVCGKAVERYPTELRFQYQLARALAIKADRHRAKQILQKLVRQQYPAAYDNLGWLAITEQRNFSRAVELFRAGVRLGDPDAMVSLAEMIDKAKTVPLNPSETKLALYARAAHLGDPAAVRALRVEQQREIEIEQQRAMQIEQQRRAMEMFQVIIRGIGR